MTQDFTPGFVQNSQSNLSTKLATNSLIAPEKVQDHYFQLLIFNESPDNNQPQLVYGTLRNLQKKYGINPEDFLCPEKGFKTASEEFCPLNLENMYEWNSIYLLYQTRKLSQMIAHTWLDILEDDPIKKKVDFVKKILRFPNLKSKIYWLTTSEEEPQTIKEIELAKKLLESRQDLTAWLIKPEHINYDKIALALLLSGQAFYKNGDKLAQIWTPFASLYELIYLYSIDVSWDIFSGVIKETSNIGGKQKFPANHIAIPYPPRPSEFNLSQCEIATWANAKDDYDPQAQDQYSFYPEKNTEDWKDKKVNCVYPPFAYIPLSTL